MGICHVKARYIAEGRRCCEKSDQMPRIINPEVGGAYVIQVMLPVVLQTDVRPECRRLLKVRAGSEAKTPGAPTERRTHAIEVDTSRLSPRLLLRDPFRYPIDAVNLAD